MILSLNGIKIIESFIPSDLFILANNLSCFNYNVVLLIASHITPYACAWLIRFLKSDSIKGAPLGFREELKFWGIPCFRDELNFWEIPSIVDVLLRNRGMKKLIILELKYIRPFYLKIHESKANISQRRNGLDKTVDEIDLIDSREALEDLQWRDPETKNFVTLRSVLEKALEQGCAYGRYYRFNEVYKKYDTMVVVLMGVGRQVLVREKRLLHANIQDQIEFPEKRPHRQKIFQQETRRRDKSG